ncbi:MAG: DUF2227 family putative metal-binding protein [Parachlamydiales bacterium]|jgi:uncharacterized metal-binding protein
MALYSTHWRFNLTIFLPFSLFLLNYCFHPETKYLIAFALVFTYSSLFFHPDLDLAYKNRLFSLKGLLTLPFRPYSRLFSHRRFSHLPIIGALTRLIYLALLLSLLFGFFHLEKPSFTHDLWQYRDFFGYSFLAIVLADLGHLLLDWL